MSAILLLTACAIFLVAFWLYISGDSQPAFASWALWSVVVFVNVITYLDLTAHWIKAAVLFTDFVICTGVAGAMLIRARMAGQKISVDETDKRIMLLSLVAVLLWRLFESPEGGNVLNQVAYVLAFIPNYRNAWARPFKEPLLPWVLWGFAFGLNVLSLPLDPASTGWDYVAPVICFVFNSGMAWAILHRRNALGE